MPSTPVKLNAILAALCLLLAGCASQNTPSDTSALAHPTAQWILACRVGNGGFGCYPGDSAFTSRTGMALEALEALGALESLPQRDSLVAWLQARQQKDGGFLESESYLCGKELPWGTKSALEPTYWALHTLRMLDAAPTEPEAAYTFVTGRQKESGGYDAYEYCFGASPDALFSTFWALGALRELGRAVPDSARTLEWVLDQQETEDRRGGFALDMDWHYGSVAGSYYGMKCLELLGGWPRHPERLRQFLLGMYGQEPDGGFECGHGQGWSQDHFSRTEDTHAAVSVMHLLGQPLADRDHSRAPLPRTDCVRWLGSVQNADGGFGRFGVNGNIFLPPPSEMRATWQAALALRLLGADIPRPAHPVKPSPEVQVHVPQFRHPCVNSDDPAEVWAFRRIALPIYEHFFQLTGSRLKALGMVNRWASAAVAPHNGAWLTQGRGILIHGWGQCGTMSWLFQELATSIDFATRASFIIADVNCEVKVQEPGWDRAHWCLFVPFTNEFPDPTLLPPDSTDSGWSILDMAVNYRLMQQDPERLSPTHIAARLFSKVTIETVDPDNGTWGQEFKVDSTTTYSSPVADSLYPDQSW